MNVNGQYHDERSTSWLDKANKPDRQTICPRKGYYDKYGTEINLREDEMKPEQRICNDCGEVWNDTGDYECPFCASTNTEPFVEVDTPEPD